MRRAEATASSARKLTPPSENESGVTLTTPITEGRGNRSSIGSVTPASVIGGGPRRPGGARRAPGGGPVTPPDREGRRSPPPVVRHPDDLGDERRFRANRPAGDERPVRRRGRELMDPASSLEGRDDDLLAAVGRRKPSGDDDPARTLQRTWAGAERQRRGGTDVTTDRRRVEGAAARECVVGVLSRGESPDLIPAHELWMPALAAVGRPHHEPATRGAERPDGEGAVERVRDPEVEAAVADRKLLPERAAVGRLPDHAAGVEDVADVAADEVEVGDGAPLRPLDRVPVNAAIGGLEDCPRAVRKDGALGKIGRDQTRPGDLAACDVEGLAAVIGGRGAGADQEESALVERCKTEDAERARRQKAAARAAVVGALERSVGGQDVEPRSAPAGQAHDLRVGWRADVRPGLPAVLRPDERALAAA